MGVFYFWRFFFEHILRHKPYLAKTTKERNFYLSLWGANTHHVIVLSYALNNFMTPNCDNANGVWTWFKDETCFMTVDKRHVHTALIGAGYLIYDFIILFFYVGADDNLAI
jgi:hypothetical protein